MARPRTFDRDSVIEGAVAVFREKGFEATSIPDLVERLGICRQALYNEFTDKKGLYREALERWGRQEIDAKIALLSGPGSPLENVRTVVRGWASYATACPGNGCFTARAIVESASDPEALAIAESHVADLESAFAKALTAARSAGELRAGARPERLARALVVGAHGIGVLSRLSDSGHRIADSVDVLLAVLDSATA